MKRQEPASDLFSWVNPLGSIIDIVLTGRLKSTDNTRRPEPGRREAFRLFLNNGLIISIKKLRWQNSLSAHKISMAIICAAILDRSKTLLSRQYVEIPKLRVEAILSKFLTLISQDIRSKTCIESESVKYLYIPVETIFFLIVTDKSSNIITDSDTLRTFHQIVAELVPAGPMTSEVSGHCENDHLK